MIKTKKIHFLTFEQVHFIGEDCGPTDLFYQIEGSDIVITFRFKEGEEKELTSIKINSYPIPVQYSSYAYPTS